MGTWSEVGHGSLLSHCRYMSRESCGHSLVKITTCIVTGAYLPGTNVQNIPVGRITQDARRNTYIFRIVIMSECIFTIIALTVSVRVNLHQARE